MADSKISALPASTVPLAGTEVLPIVQGSATKQVTVANLTAGRAVAVDTLAVANGATLSAVSPNANPLIIQGAASTANTLLIRGGNGNAQSGILFTEGGTPAQVSFQISTNQLVNGAFDITPSTTVGGTTFSNPAIRITSTSDVNIKTGNLIQGTAAKGINFTANTPAAGMTSQLLNWYEDGTWTPAQGAGLTLVGAFSSTGKYTRIGRSVTISGTVTGATSVAIAAAGIITSNLPFTAGTAGHGAATNAANTAFASVICTTTNVTSAGAIAATATITFSATYFV